VSATSVNGRRRALAGLLLAACAPGIALAQDPRGTAAQLAARDWLAIADGGDAAASWKAASTLFRETVDEARWAKAISTIRGPLGAVVTRTLAGTQFYAEIPGLPGKGEYVMLVFRTAFETREGAVERVTVARDSDGAFRVAGYEIS
jgi:hypothetical protein